MTTETDIPDRALEVLRKVFAQRRLDFSDLLVLGEQGLDISPIREQARRERDNPAARANDEFARLNAYTERQATIADIEAHLEGRIGDGTYAAPSQTLTAQEIRESLWELYDSAEEPIPPKNGNAAMTLHSEIVCAIRGATDDGANTTAEYADAVLPVVAQRIREIARAEFQPTFGVSYSGLDAQERLFRAADLIERGEA